MMAGAVTGDGVALCEGMLSRKQEYELTTYKRAVNRSWDKVYCVLNNKTLAFFKDQKHYKKDPASYFKPPIPLAGVSAVVATDYTIYKKRPHVFRLKLPKGGEFLFQCKDEEEMITWNSKIKEVTGGDEERAPPYALIPPAGAHKPIDNIPSEKPSFFSLTEKK